MPAHPSRDRECANGALRACRPSLLIARVALLLVVSVASLLGASGAGAVALAAPSPSPSPEEAASPFAFTAWHVAEITTTGNPAETPDAPDAISLVFGEGDVVMVETVNQCATATGTIALQTSGAVVPNLATPTGSTNSCERRSLEERFLNLVNLATTWTLDDDRLTLTLMDGGTIVLIQTIVGTTWQWTEFQSGKGDTVTPEADEPNAIVFGTDGMVTMTVPCDTLTAPYTLEGTSGLTIDTSALPESSDPCVNGSRLAMGAMRSYVFRDGHLWISLMADAGIYEFVAVESQG